jgi:hypothetical protein
LGIRELSLHPHSGQSHFEVAAKTGAKPIAAGAFSNGAWGWLQILTIAPSKFVRLYALVGKLRFFATVKLLMPAEPIHKLVEAASGEESCVGR